MADIKKEFSDSLDLLKKNKRIVIPVLLSIILPVIFLYLFLSMSGLLPLIKELTSVSAEFEKQKLGYLTTKENVGRENYTLEAINYLGRESSSSEYNKQLGQYIIQKGFDWGRVMALLNARNIALLMIFLIISFITSLYLSSMYYAAITLAIKKEDIRADNLLRKTNAFVLRLFSFKIIWLGIALAPVVVIGFFIWLSAVFFSFNKMFLVLSSILLFLLFLAYIIYASMKIFFAIPSIYIEEENAFSSIRRSFGMTKGRLKEVVLVFLIIYIINYAIGMFMTRPLIDSYLNFLFREGAAIKTISFILVIIFLALESVALAFTHIFRFYAYLDFKQSG